MCSLGSRAGALAALLPRCPSTLCSAILEPYLDLALRQRKPISQSGPLGRGEVLSGTESLLKLVYLVARECCSSFLFLLAVLRAA